MNWHNYLKFLQPVVVFALFSLPLGALAKDCNLSLSPVLKNACPADAIGASTLNPDFQGARLEPNTEGKTAIDAFGFCRYLGSQDKNPIFIPFGTEEEWRAYIPNHPLSVYLIQCSRGGLIPVPPNFGTDSTTNQCATPPDIQSIRAPYKPANVPGDIAATPITYACRSSDGTEFNEDAVAILTPHDSGYGPTDDIGWTIDHINYNYEAKCGAAKGVATKTAPKDNLCSVGKPSSVFGLGPYTWICSGGNGGGRNRTCSTDTTCETFKVDEGSCRCEEGKCYRPVYFADDCGHSWVDKSLTCDTPEPILKPLPPFDNDNPHLNPNTPAPYAQGVDHLKH